MKGIDAQKWPHSMHAVYNSLVENQTWAAVKRPVGQNVIACKWIYYLEEEHLQDG